MTYDDKQATELARTGRAFRAPDDIIGPLSDAGRVSNARTEVATERFSCRFVRMMVVRMPEWCPLGGLVAKQIATERKKIVARLIKWGGPNYVAFPWRRARSRFHALIAELLLQRTRAEQVVPVYTELCRRYASPKALASASTAEIATLLKPLGLHWRVPLVRKLSTELAAKGSVPRKPDLLLALPGVGAYACAAYLSLHAGIRAPIVDSNVVRLYGRLFGLAVGPETRRKKWFIELAEKMTPQRQFKSYNYALLDFTRAICTPTPRCGLCPLVDICEYGAKTQQTVRVSPEIHPMPAGRTGVNRPPIRQDRNY